MKVSIVIAVEEINDLVRDNIRHCLAMDYQDFEILLFLSHPTSESFPKTRIVVRADLAFNPAQRRDLAINEAQGEILAFIDDDAYPESTWLTAALPYFSDITIAAVGGPGVTPPEDDLRKQVSGWCSASPLGGGPSAFYRFLPSKVREVQDYPSMNLIVRKADFSMVGGFDSSFWPGEDTKLCADLTLKIGKKIIYDPKVLVYHHRRAIFKDHLRQNGRYGFHRGYFARILPQTSRKLVYLFPSLFTILVLLMPAVAIITQILGFSRRFGRDPDFTSGQFFIFNFITISLAYFLMMAAYLLLLVVNALWVWRISRRLPVALLTMPAIFLTHFWYGAQFIRGFFSKKVKR